MFGGWLMLLETLWQSKGWMDLLLLLFRLCSCVFGLGIVLFYFVAVFEGLYCLLSLTNLLVPIK